MIFHFAVRMNLCYNKYDFWPKLQDTPKEPTKSLFIHIRIEKPAFFPERSLQCLSLLHLWFRILL